MCKMAKRAKIRLSTDSDQSDSLKIISDDSSSPDNIDRSSPPEDENQDGSMELVVSSQGGQPVPKGGPGRRSRYSMNYQSYEATRIQPAEQTRRMLDYMFPGYQKRDPRNWYEKATQTNLNSNEVNSYIGIELMEVEAIDSEEEKSRKSIVDRVSQQVPVDDDEDDDHTPMSIKTTKLTSKPHRSSVIARGWDGPPIKMTGKSSEEGFLIKIHDLQHDPQTIMVPKEVFNQKTLEMDVVPDERGIPKVVVYVGDKDQRPSEVTVDSNTRDSTTVVLYDNKDDFDAESISTTSELTPVQTEEEEVEPEPEPSPPPEPTPPPPPPAKESSSDEVMIEDIPARDSVIFGEMSSDHVEIEYDLDDEPEEPADESDEGPGYVPQLDIVNSRLLEPVHSQGDKSDVEVDLVPFFSSSPVQETDPDLTLAKEVSDWLATEVLAKAMLPRKKAVPPEPKAVTPESSPVPVPEPRALTPEPFPVPLPEPKAPTPEPSPAPPPEPKRNLSKEVSDWLNDNILDGAKQAAADRKFSKEVSDWLQKSILENAKPAADLYKTSKPTPPEPKPEPAPELSPPPKAGSHASSPGDRLFSPLENYPNDMDEDTSKHRPTVPPMAPSQVSKEDVPLRALEDYPPQYSSHDSTPSSRKISDSKSPSPKSVVLPIPVKQPEKSPSATGSHASSPGDRLFSPLEDHPSDSPNVSPSRAQSKTPSPKPGVVSSEHKGNVPSPSHDTVSVSLTPSSGKVVRPKAMFKPELIPIEDNEHVSPPERDSSPIRDVSPLRDRPSQSKSPFSEQVVQPDKPTSRPPSVGIEEDKLEPPTTHDTYGSKPIMKSDGSINRGSLIHPQIKLKSSSLSPEPFFLGDPVGQDDRASLTEADVSGWLNESILMPATAENWVENKILKKAQVLANENSKYSGEPESINEPKTESSRSPKSVGVERRKESLKKGSPSGQRSPDDMEKEVEDWMENEVLIPAKVENWVDRKILNPAEKQRSPVQKQIIPSVWAPPSTSLSSFEEPRLSSVREVVKVPRVSPTSEEIENWISSEVIEPAKAASWVQSEVLEPAEVSVAVEEQILEPASSRASEQSPQATAASPTHKNLRFRAKFMQGEEDKAVPMEKDPSCVLVESKVDEPHQKKPDGFAISYEPNVEQPIEQKPIIDDSLSWVDSSHNVSPFQPHPDHPGDPILQKKGDVLTRFPQFPDEKSTSVTHGLPTNDSAPPMPGMPGMPVQVAPPTVGTIPPTYGRQPYDKTAQPSQIRPYPSSTPQSDLKIIVTDPTFVELPPSIPAQLDGSSLEPSSANVASSQAASPLKREDSSSLLTSKPQIPSSQIGVEPSLGKEASRYDKQEHDSARSAKPEETEKMRESILKNAGELLEAMQHKSSPSKPGKSETRSSLLEKRAIQQDNYLTRDDDEDYKPRNKPSKRRKSSSASDLHRRRSDSFLSDKQTYNKSPSIFSKLCSPLSKIINKHKSPTRTKKNSIGPSYDSDSESYDYNPPPIPTKESEGENSTMLGRKMSSRHSDLGDTSNLLSAKSVRPEPIKEESDEKTFELQQPDASKTGQPAQMSTASMGPTPTGIPGTFYGQPGAPSPTYEQPPQDFLSNDYKDLSQHGHPSPVPYQASSGAPPPGSGYPEDIQTSTLPKFSDYKEAAKRRLDPEKGFVAPRIPNPPKKGFPTFPDYNDLIAPKDELAAKDHSWFDAERQPASTAFESKDSFPEVSANSLTKRISADSKVVSEIITVMSEDPSSQAPLHVDTSTSPLHFHEVSDERKEETYEDEKSLAVKRVKPMAPGNGVPMFQDYYDLPAGEFPLFLDSPLLAPSMDKRQYAGAPTTASSLQPQTPSTQPFPIGSVTPSSQNLQRPWEMSRSTPQGSASRPAELGLQRPEGMPISRPQGVPVSPNITRYSYSHPDRHLSELLHPSPPAPKAPKHLKQQGSNLYPEARLPVFQTPNSYFPQPMDATSGQTHEPTKLQPTDKQLGQQTLEKRDFYALENPKTGSPSYMTPRPQSPWEIPSTIPYSTTGHLIPSMGKPGDYDRRQMFDPEGLPKQAAEPWTSIPAQKPYSASSGLTPTGHQMSRPDDNNQQQINYPQSFPSRAPGNVDSAVQPYSTSPGQIPNIGRPSENNLQQMYYPQHLPVAFPPAQQLQPASEGQTPQTPTFTKHYYLQPDRPILELLHPQNPQQDSPQPNFKDAHPEQPREHPPLPPGGGVPKFSDYDQLVQPQISGDHEPSLEKPKIVTAAEKKAEIEREMQPITKQMEDLKKKMYLLTSQKGPPIRTGPHSAYSRMPTSLELYNELESRTMKATKKDREEFYAEQRKKIYEENARRKIRRAIERSKTTK